MDHSPHNIPSSSGVAESDMTTPRPAPSPAPAVESPAPIPISITLPPPAHTDSDSNSTGGGGSSGLERQGTLDRGQHASTAPQRSSILRASSPLSFNHEQAPSASVSYEPRPTLPPRNETLRGSIHQPLPPLPPSESGEHASEKQDTARREFNEGSYGRSAASRPVSNAHSVDWIVPIKKPPQHQRLSVGERLAPTLQIAEKEKKASAFKGKTTAFALNLAIGLQVLLSALTTGLSASLNGRATSIGLCVIGGIATLVASYLAKVRGSNEPEFSKGREKELAQFIREARAFQLDHGHSTTTEFDDRLEKFRTRLEHIMANDSDEFVNSA
ncbi:hypothetical protein CYLTODRAFT_426986 [Cylindrobasidium torrendii FP15055 ss-10]|uniref:SMODS and SLOG-associating 2TM effector domain-containing protein n=1 Tax=Cylindrobasidium torrendii FP15055 ss-10 TaxID=1314674 RepID=A0A0D7AVY7_9AGAR|nr:hypothetical protein CYLTODRAFT_426986 [Cylindrobasidium torrendii FP15055 ss-10]